MKIHEKNSQIGEKQEKQNKNWHGALLITPRPCEHAQNFIVTKNAAVTRLMNAPSVVHANFTW